MSFLRKMERKLRHLPLRDRLAAVSQMKRNGEWKPESNILFPQDDKVEYDANGHELLTLSGARWLQAHCQAIVTLGLAVECYYSGDPIQLYFRNLEGGMSRLQIPNEAVNARDIEWILKRLMGPAVAKYAQSLGKEAFSR